MRPCGPEPFICERSIPLSAAIRFASGLANTRSPFCRTGLGVSSRFGVTGAAGVASAFGSVASAFGDVGADDVTLSAADGSSPSRSRTAIGSLTGTPSVPSAISSFPITPSSTASISIVALSVSISASRSPDFTSSPSFTSHLASVPSSIVGESAGIRIDTGIGSLPQRYMTLFTAATTSAALGSASFSRLAA